jgi:hypothetical protein
MLVLGYQNDDVAAKFSKFIEPAEPQCNNVDGLSDQMSKLNRVSITINQTFLSSALCSQT